MKDETKNKIAAHIVKFDDKNYYDVLKAKIWSRKRSFIYGNY